MITFSAVFLFCVTMKKVMLLIDSAYALKYNCNVVNKAR